MPVEFALRPRIRLREGFTPPRRSRLRLPRYVLPVAAYWLAAGGLVYAFVHAKDSAHAEPTADATTEPQPAPEAARAWWQLTPAPVPSAPVPSAPAPVVAVEPPGTAPTATLPVLQEQTAEPEVAQEGAPVPRGAPVGASTPEPRRPFREEPPSWQDTVPSMAALASEREQRERNDAPADAPLPPTPPARNAPHAGSPLPSCEAATAAANQDVDFSSGNRGADLPTSAIAAVLENGAWLSSCSVPATTSIDVCVAIKAGAVTGVSVVSRPADSSINACVSRRAAALQFPYSPRLDIARTRF